MLTAMSMPNAPRFASSMTFNVRNTRPPYKVSRMKSNAHTVFISGTTNSDCRALGSAAGASLAAAD
jgi:hypothetical protein